MYKKSEIPGNGLKNFQNVFKMLTMLVHYAKTKQNFQILVFAKISLKSFVETFPNQRAIKTFLVSHIVFYVIFGAL